MARSICVVPSNHTQAQIRDRVEHWRSALVPNWRVVVMPDLPDRAQLVPDAKRWKPQEIAIGVVSKDQTVSLDDEFVEAAAYDKLVEALVLGEASQRLPAFLGLLIEMLAASDHRRLGETCGDGACALCWLEGQARELADPARGAPER